MENTVEKMVEKPRYDFIDILRIVACFLVIVNHTITLVFYEADPSASWFVSLIWFFVSKLSVPVFVMITGYTMLDRQDSYKKAGMRIVKAVIALCVFSFGYYMFQWIIGDRTTIGVIDFFLAVMENPLSLAYWYMYMYIGLLIMMPFLQKLVASLNKRDCEIFIILSLFIFGTWPVIEHWIPALNMTGLVDVALFDSYIGMLLIAYYIKKYITPSRKLLMGSMVGFVVCIIFNVIMTYHEYLITGGKDYLFYDDRVFLPIVIEGACFFYMMTHVSLKGWIAKFIKVVAGCTFGIYLISDFIYGISQPIYSFLCQIGLHEIIAMLIYECMIFMAGFVVIYIMKKIPILKNVL